MQECRFIIHPDPDEEVMMKKSKLIFFTAFGEEIWYFIISLKILD